jgi:hypothetical protein
MLFAALAATSVVVAEWSTKTVDALHHGMSYSDTIWYHMPFAARFVQDGSITALHFVDFGTDIPYYPQNGELYHALGILFLGNDYASPFINMGWLALLFLAAWCIGRPFGLAPLTLVAAAVLMATPGLVATQPGGGYTDIVGLALLAAAVALLINSEELREFDCLPAYGLPALATGLVLGTKLTFVAPVVALTLAVWVLPPHGIRRRRNCLWSLLVLVTGSFWYLRNLVAIGNPLPVSLHLGPFRLPSPPGLAPASSVAHFLLNRYDWSAYFLPGLRQALGPAWWAILALTAAGLLLGVFATPGPLYRLLAGVGLVSGVAFVFTPQPLTLLGAPYNFVYNLRYSFAALIIGLTIIPIVPIVATTRARWWLFGAFGVILAATQLDSTIWPTDLFSPQFAPAVRGWDSFIGLLVGMVVFGIGTCLIVGVPQPRALRPSPQVLVATGIVVLGLGFGLQQFYLNNRYLNTTPMAPLYAWAQHVRNTRMAITGPFSNDTYPLYGPDESNYVQVVGRQGTHGSFSPIPDCPGFHRAINAGHYRNVITVTAGDVRDPTATGSRQTMWVSQDPAATLIFRRAVYGYLFKKTVFSVFRLSGSLNPESC